ncbi:MAG: MarR family transcriptional regulator [archaeon]
MIDFACKQFKIEEIIKCSLMLTKADFKVLVMLSGSSKEWFTTEQLAKKLKLNLSTVQRAVKKLHGSGLVDRNQNNLDNGGYIYIYRAKAKEDVRSVIMGIVNNWVIKVESELKKW